MSGTGVTGAVRESLRACVREQARRPPPAEVEVLLDLLRTRIGSNFVGAIYYGSHRRCPTAEALVDLHLLVTDLQAALGLVAGSLCRVLPPNVYYLETRSAQNRVRCKYAVLSVGQFRRVCTRQAFHSYFWARYAQPVSLVGVAEDYREALEESLVDALATCLSRVLPVFPDMSDPVALWEAGLARCYGCELRPEGRNRSQTLVAACAPYYQATAAAVLADRRTVLAANSPRAARLSWAFRAYWGKALSLIRLLKAFATFTDGLDYAVWKLERHTGRRIDIPDRVRANPWRHIGRLLWQLLREGGLR